MMMDKPEACIQTSETKINFVIHYLSAYPHYFRCLLSANRSRIFGLLRIIFRKWNDPQSRLLDVGLPMTSRT